MIPFARYMIWKCKHCNRWQGKQNNKWTEGMTDIGRAQAIRQMVLNCVYCRKSTKLKDKVYGELKVEVEWFHNVTEIRQAILKKNTPI